MLHRALTAAHDEVTRSSRECVCLVFVKYGSVIDCVCLLLQYLLQSCSRGGGGDNGGHVLRSRDYEPRPVWCVDYNRLVCPSLSRTSERGGEGYCVNEGGGEEGERERERTRKVRLHYSLGYSG